ncbi:MAG: carbohydrate-binding protein [Hamadaea sp.]|nr:carbohydrate-binding protein [Hamadaea sp.]
MVKRRTLFGAVGAAAVGGVMPPPGPASAHAAAAVGAVGEVVDPWEEVPTILARVVPPTFADRTFDIRSYGAVGDNSTDCTAAFRSAIQACNAAGGGRVVVPAGGTYRTGKITLLSNVNLHIEPTATIRFRSDSASYLPAVFSRWQGIECYNHSPFIYALNQTNVAITGTGTIDGNATAGSWSSWGGGGDSWTQLQQQGRDGVPVSQRQYGTGTTLRPNLVGLYNVTNLLLEGFTATNPAMWMIHPVYCTNVTIRGLTLRSTNSQGDGVDVDSCTDVLVTGCRMDTNDDCVVIKSGRDADGRRVARPSQYVVVQSCKFSGRWGGVTVGSEMSGGVRKIFAEDCENNPADFPGRYPVKYPLYVKTNKQRGGFVEDVHLRRITARNLERDGLHITTVYNGTTTGSFIPTLRNFTVDAMTVTTARAAWSFEGQADVPITGVRIAESTFTGMAQAYVTEHTDVSFRNVRVNGVLLGGTAGTRYEAENAVISQGVVESNHAGFSGTGFVNLDNLAGSWLEWTVSAPVAGQATLTVGYANGTTADRPMALTVGGAAAGTLAFPPTGAWTTWRTVAVSVPLSAGSTAVRLTSASATGGPNLDYLDVGEPTGPAPVDYQAEEALIGQGVVESNHAGFTGSGFVNGDNVVGSYVEWTVPRAVAATTPLVIRYANGTTTNRPMNLRVNGVDLAGSLDFPGTGAWSTWALRTVSVALVAGVNTIRLTASTVSGGPNLDKLTVG